MAESPVYLDNAASTRPFEEVTERMNEINSYIYGNSSSVHKKGLEAHSIIKDARNKLAEILDCRPDEIIFTSGGSESNNMAIKGYAFARLRTKGNILTSPFEHPTVMKTVESMEYFGYEKRFCELDDGGRIDPGSILENADTRTLLATVMTVNSETGAFADMNYIGSMLKEKNPDICVHTDAVQAFGKYSMDMHDLSNIDMMSMSAHKIKGPKGVGALFLRKGTRILPLVEGGGHQNGLRAGTENTAGIAGFALAAEIFRENSKKYFQKVSELNEYTRKSLAESIEDYIINSPEGGSPYILNIAFGGVMSETLLNHLSGQGIYVSAGSACSSRNGSNSHVLEAMSVPDEYINGALRISFGPDSTIEEVDAFVREVAGVLPLLRKFRKR